MGHGVAQNPVAHGHQRQGGGDGDNQHHGVQQGFQNVPRRPPGGPQVIGRPHGAHQGVGGPHGEVDGEHQPKHHQMGAGIPAHIGEVDLDEVRHPPGQNLPQGQQDTRHVQPQQTQQGADEDEKGKEHKQQVERQGGALNPHVVPQVPLDHEIGPPENPAAGKLQFHRKPPPFQNPPPLRREIRISGEDGRHTAVPTSTCSRPPGSTPRWPPRRCGRWEP